MINHPIIIERLLNAPAAKVWTAITESDEMKEWYFDLPGFKAEKGYQFQFTGGPPEKKYLHLCEVTEVVAGQKLTYSWRYDGYAGISYGTFNVEAKGDQTQLTLTHDGLETFPEDEPDFARKNFEAGWDHIVNISLKEYVETVI